MKIKVKTGVSNTRTVKRFTPGSLGWGYWLMRAHIAKPSKAILQIITVISMIKLMGNGLLTSP
jgi:hypothetical protein